jgi:NADPH:quinone reductase-like Zn-dependent oxidoreductase
MSSLAMVMPGPGQPLELVERPVPQPAPGEVVVRVRASSLNYHDLVNLKGVIPGPWPRVPMSDGAGEVVAVGDGVSGWRVGDRAMGSFHPRWLDGRLTRDRRRVVPGDTEDGWLCQHRAFAADALVRTPHHLSDVEAATVVCAGTTAWSALRGADVHAGDVVVTQGTGGVSAYVVQLAKAQGCTVIVTSSSPAKLARFLDLGADHGIVTADTPDWEKRVRELTDGDGADLVVDLGGRDTIARSVKATRMDGHVAIVGVLGGATDVALPLTDAMTRQIRLFGVSVGSVAAQRALCRAMAASSINPPVSHTFGWADLGEATRVQQAGEHVGKIGITIP